MLNKMLKNKKGFTLVELIVVIAILGILAAVLVPSISNYVNRANENAALSEASAFGSAAVRAKIEVDSGLAASGATVASLLAADGYAADDYTLVWSGNKLASGTLYTTSKGTDTSYDGTKWSLA